MTPRSQSLRLAGALTAVAIVVLLMYGWVGVANAATVSIVYLLLVLLVAATSSLWVAAVTSVAAMLAINFFFLPPVGTFSIADPQNWVALFAFLVVSLVASHLSAIARARTDEALGRRDELARLFDLSRDVLSSTDSREALAVLARAIARRFDLEYVAVALPRGEEWDLFEAGAPAIAIDPRELSNAFAVARTSLEFDANARTYAGHRVVTVGTVSIRLVPLRVGTKPVGILAAGGRPVEAGTLDTLAGVVAIAIERAEFLEERRTGELTRQSEQLKTTLLASLGHDLRTPLTAIRVAATNVKSADLPEADRLEQADVILGEVERLTRLFHNVVEMARIDAGAVAPESRWAYPSEVIAAARERVEQTVGHHPMVVDVDRDVPIRLDARLAAAALAHLVENAAQYSPAESPIDVRARLTDAELVVEVRDRGPGIAAADLPHVFERFYRGDAGQARTSGTGMGLWIARSLLATAHGRVWAENAADGGALFTMAVPAVLREPAATASPVS
jgi:two-component system, OmpR family, sensor histidine kinase KdpD